VSVPFTRTTLDEYRRERLRRLERENEYLAGERRRLELLLADALLVAVAGTTVAPLALLAVLCELAGTDPAVARYRELRLRRLIEGAIR
jgi:hypothetical protein